MAFIDKLISDFSIISKIEHMQVLKKLSAIGSTILKTPVPDLKHKQSSYKPATRL